MKAQAQQSTKFTKLLKVKVKKETSFTDIKDLNIKLGEDQIKDYSKNKWKILVKNVIKQCAF